MALSPTPPEELATKAWQLHLKLLDIWGEHPWKPWGDPMEVFLSTILSQRTNYHNQRKAYRALFKEFGSFDDIRQGHPDAIERCIKPVTFAERKAPVIKDALEFIHAHHGQLTLDFLSQMPVDDAMAWLTQIKGVGLKTASCVLIFSPLKMPVLPVDTHVQRTSRRWGLFDKKTSAIKAHDLLNAALPKEVDVLYNFHMNAFNHGRKICTYYSPKCGVCDLADSCDWANSHPPSPPIP